MKVVDAIATTKTGNKSGMPNVPLEPVIIKKAWQKKLSTEKSKTKEEE